MKPIRFLYTSALATVSLLLWLAHGAPAFAGNVYQQTNLVSDLPNVAAHMDPNLQNPWGLALSSTSFIWAADNGTGVSTLYTGDGIAQSLVVTIPPPPPSTDIGHPTGTVFNGGSGFSVSNGTTSGAARFIFATEDGTIAGWAPTVDGTHAIIAVNHSADGAVYKGLAIAGSRIYTSNFVQGRVEVYDDHFAPVTLAADAFTDANLPPGFAPFGIQNIAGQIFVAYALRETGGIDEVHGRGLGFIDVYDVDGNFIRRFASANKLNAPWGMALAPSNFGKFSNRVLIGNFGDGLINTYDYETGEFTSQIKGAKGKPIQIDGLWGLVFGNGAHDQPKNTLFFAAGIDDEAHGLFGRIDMVPNGDGDDEGDD
jgi:uncharacterized protein (TIGR03118 family)